MPANLAALMRVLQLGDSTLPVGAFSFSNGLESAAQDHVVHDLETLRQFVRAAIKQAASTDGIGLIQAFRAARKVDHSRIQQVDQAVFNRKLNEEMRTMTVRMGRKLVELAHQVSPSEQIQAWLKAIQDKQTPGTYPVSQGLVFAALGLEEADAFAVHQYGLASMMLSASLRLLKLSYIDTQTLLFELNAEVQDHYETAARASLEDMAAFVPGIDVLAALHVRSRVRMFMN